MVAGEKKSAILFRYILPNTVAPVVIQATLIMSKAVLEEAAISYLGYGVQPPNASWGLLLSEDVYKRQAYSRAKAMNIRTCVRTCV